MCNCTDGWHGDSCDVPSCHGANNCTDQGVCIAHDLCECYDGFEGMACDEVSSPNEVTPVFLQSSYNTTIPENTPSGSVILTVQANDTDIGRSGDISYSLAFGIEFFAIDSDNGDISPQFAFDYESTLLPNQFELIAIAEDGGSPALSSTVNVIVFVSDLNDNCPELYSGDLITNVILPSDAPNETVVHQIFAEDADSGLNAELLYNFFQVPESVMLLFAVSDNGTIRTLAPVPAGLYDLKVSVSDQGNPPCSITIQVNVDVIDVEPVLPSTIASTTFGKITILLRIL